MTTCAACALSRWRAWERSARFVAVWAAFITLTLFYLIPIGAIQALINIDQLRKIHVFAVIIDLPVVKSIVVAILPGVKTWLLDIESEGPLSFVGWVWSGLSNICKVRQA